MALQFPAQLRFAREAKPMPKSAVGAVEELIDQIAATAPVRKDVFEIVKHRFGNASISSSTDYAQFDMRKALEAFEKNAALFIEALWTALEEIAEQGVPTPPVETLNAILREHSVGYVISPPELLQTISLSTIPPSGAEAPGTEPVGYVLGARLGNGAFGDVFRATRNAGVATFEFAIKVHNPSPFASAEKALKRFTREVQALQRLQHRGVVPYLDAGVNDAGCPFLVMPVIDGVNIRDATSPDAPAKAVAYLIEVVTALVYAHSKDVLHRDLKPPNILVRSSDDQPVIVDFGLAYVFEEATKESLTSAAPGSAGYMPPEVVVNPKARSPLHDIYSCGVILYELLARRLPEDPRTVSLARIDAKLAAVDGVVQKALAPAATRYQSAEELLKALKALKKKLHDAS